MVAGSLVGCRVVLTDIIGFVKEGVTFVKSSLEIQAEEIPKDFCSVVVPSDKIVAMNGVDDEYAIFDVDVTGV